MARDPARFSMEGESREMTVLFSDVRGFTTISEGLDPKALSGAERLGLPKDPDRLVTLAGDIEPAVLAAALVRAALDKEVAEDSLRRAA